MNPLEAQLHYPFGDTLPALGEVIDIRPGVRWLRMELPFALNHINLWLLEDEAQTESGPMRGWTIVDCGIDSETTRHAWETVFANALDGMPVLRVITTHCHPDHIGLAHWLCKRWNAPLWMTAAEYSTGRLLSAAMPGTNGDAMLAHFQQHGVTDPETLEKLQARKHHYPKLAPEMPHAFIRLQDGQTLRIGAYGWRIIAGYGHSPEHAMLFCAERNILISGDLILPRISTNVSVMPLEPESDPVRLYLDSLAKCKELPDDTLILPSHGKPFQGLHTRIRQLNEHHAARLEEVAAACSAPCSAADIVPLMFKPGLDAHQLTFALGEALAHLHRLWFQGVLQRRKNADGVVRFVRIPA
jgi:glyoxylase-like metal-dependent hydrolase (beta-lactamase superfamily II)